MSKSYVAPCGSPSALLTARRRWEAFVKEGAGASPSATPLTIGVAASYQPTSRFWPIQWAETGIYLALALALAGFCYWRLARRLP